jgi:hypothetical protein
MKNYYVISALNFRRQRKVETVPGLRKKTNQRKVGTVPRLRKKNPAQGWGGAAIAQKQETAQSQLGAAIAQGSAKIKQPRNFHFKIYYFDWCRLRKCGTARTLR